MQTQQRVQLPALRNRSVQRRSTFVVKAVRVGDKVRIQLSVVIRRGANND